MRIHIYLTKDEIKQLTIGKEITVLLREKDLDDLINVTLVPVSSLITSRDLEEK